MQLTIQQAVFPVGKRTLTVEDLTIRRTEFWVVVGGNGSGKSVFARTLRGDFPLTSGRFDSDFCKIGLSSFEQQQQLVEAIFHDRNNDTVDPDDFGLTARQVILAAGGEVASAEYYAAQLNILALLDRPFVQLSTGESRKVLLCQLLAGEPDLLILDEPFEGLDQQSVQHWLALFDQLRQRMAVVLIVNRLTDIPPQATHLALLDQLNLVWQGSRAEAAQNALFQQLVYAETAVAAPLPASLQPPVPLAPDVAPFELKNVTVQYGDKQILANLSWTVRPGQHWWIKGPNGAGKSTLLSLITGDHPQAYANHVVLFGKQRGSGETIWEIKQRIGYVSSQLHMDYRVNCSVREVIVSGFFDSIGVYQRIPDTLKHKAQEWLARLNLLHLANAPFRSLSWGQQRLLLIVRAMVKHPPILILDEPLQGLDGLNRKLVKHFIDQLVQNSQTQLLFVSHQEGDAPDCISHIFEFVPHETGYQYAIRAVTS